MKNDNILHTQKGQHLKNDNILYNHFWDHSSHIGCGGRPPGLKAQTDMIFIMIM